MPDRKVLESIAEGGLSSSGRGDASVDDEDEDEEGKDADMAGDGPQDLKQAGAEVNEEEVLKKLHTLLIETSVQEGKLVCGNCGFEYPIKEGVGNFLLPGHLV